MSPLRALLVGPDSTRSRSLLVLSALLVALVTFGAYALGVFAVAGGVVWLATDAALVGAVAAAAVGYRRAGVVFAWLVAYGALLGWSADHYLLDLSGGTLERVAAFLSVDGLAFLAVEAVVVGSLAWAVGTVAGAAVRAVRESAARPEN